jgi:hypothetical protein
MNNPFRGNSDKKPEASGNVEDLGLTNVCPFLTSNSLVMVQSPVEQRLKGSPPVQPALGTSLSPCIEKACKFWSEKHQDCIVKSGLEALAWAAKSEKM